MNKVIKKNKYHILLNKKKFTSKKYKIYATLKFLKKNILCIFYKNFKNIVFKLSFKELYLLNKSLFNKLNYKEFNIKLEKLIRIFKITKLEKLIILNGENNQHLKFLTYFNKTVKRTFKNIYELEMVHNVSYNGCKLKKEKRKKKKFKNFFIQQKNNNFLKKKNKHKYKI